MTPTKPDPTYGCTTTDHIWNGPTDLEGVRFLICERCAATIPPPEVEPGRRLVPIPGEP